MNKMNQNQVEKLRENGDDNIKVELIRPDGTIALTKHFTIGYEAWAYAENWKLLNPNNKSNIIDGGT